MMPGTGFPLVINSTMCANDVGYGAGGSLVVVGGGMMPLASVLGGSSLVLRVRAQKGVEAATVGRVERRTPRRGAELLVEVRAEVQVESRAQIRVEQA